MYFVTVDIKKSNPSIYMLISNYQYDTFLANDIQVFKQIGQLMLSRKTKMLSY